MAIQAYRGTLPALGRNVYVDPTALVIGAVELGDDVSVWPFAVLRGDVNHIRIGARSNVQDGSVLHVSRPYPGNDAGWAMILGEDVVVGHKVALHGCTIGDRVLVGIGSIVLDGVEVATTSSSVRAASSRRASGSNQGFSTSAIRRGAAGSCSRPRSRASR